MSYIFKPGDKIQGKGEFQNRKGEIIAVVPFGYTVFWIDESVPTRIQFLDYKKEVIEDFYERSES